MKRCPECRRDYYDDSLLYCLDDGSSLLEGPASIDDSATAILPHGIADELTRPQVLTTDRRVRTQSEPAELSKRHSPFSPWWVKLAAGLFVAALLLVGGIVATRYLKGRSSEQIESIAVMPFVNDSGNPDNEYLSDGVTDSLIKSLSSIPNLSVKARSSVFRYKGVSKDLKEIARELGVQALVNGRVTQRGDEITTSLEIVDGTTENVLWAEQYTRKQSALAAIQSEIAGDISKKLKDRLSPDDQAKVTKEYTADAEAYQLYLRGLYLQNKATPESQKESLRFFDQAISHDPGFALAYSAKADTYAILGTVFNAQMSPAEAGAQARVAADNALRLDPSLAAAYTSRGWIKFRFDWDWAAAEEDLKKGIALDPNSARSHQWYGEFLTCMRRFDDGVSEVRTARDLEPFVPIISWNLGKNLFMAGRYDEAMTEFQRTLELDANFSRVFRFTSEIYEREGKIDEAFAHFLKQPENAQLQPERVAELRRIFETKGLAAARRRSAELYLQNAPSANAKALAYLMTDDKQKAIDQLELAYTQHNGALVALDSETWWAGLRDEPRFKELLRKMRFPSATS